MFTLDQVVPWGRSFDEYGAMFALTADDLARRILGCGDGPASFNAEASRRGTTVISCDPIYRFSREAIGSRIAATYDQVIEQIRENHSDFVWEAIPTPEELGRRRLEAMGAFLDDYPAGVAQGRYVEATLPFLPFADASFELALCSHLLFLYSLQLDAAFHRASLLELVRVAQEVRVFPLLTLGGELSPHLEESGAALRAEGCTVAIEPVPYEFQRGGNAMLRIRRPAS
ncbi:hypothetical protein [Cyanobium gracile]|uniref:SAM-dependent methyltransferase n=1 Tax=Cyanobium gracile (strain ATCC 27147 / PCC 6307) TaxID=292564 RepID=K9PB39_CYAGP|nr:hypothetical protein [Cyanobium gracile]AFY30173.1 hypothetical protein Cyagr_3093 [Cyanobium gracile PCC 6307]